MKRSNRLVILVGVLLAVLAFVGIVILLGQGTSPQVVEKQTVDVLVATQDIAIGDSVTPDLVEVKAVDPAAVSGTRIADPSQLTGSPALFPIGKGSQVSQEAVGIGTSGNFCITCQLKPGEKAIAFQVETVTGLDFLIQPGDHVDIVFAKSIPAVQEAIDSTDAHPRFEPIAGLEDTVSVKTLLQDKRVLYVSATKIKPVAEPSATPAPDSGTKAEAPPVTVIIIVAGTDSDAEVIKFAQSDQTTVGPLTAILRALADTVVEDTTGITLKILIDRFGIPIPDLIQPGLPPVAP
ncbi:MAG: Flp pilus assembly protein CpaB [Chloroflexi bacterium]|nr:Flp pilus assembly protein CpaB [Chloroflexota bacterium]